MKNRKASLFVIAFLFSLAQMVYAQHISFESIRKVHRINAHGDEFMAIDLSAEGKRIVVGTEKGELIIWNIADGKIEKRFNQKFPIHAVTFSKDGQSVIGAGGDHTGKHNCSLGKWNISTGTFQTWTECGDDSLMYLGSDRESGVIATSDASGFATIWDGETGKRLAAWKTGKLTLGLGVSDKTLYLTQTSKELIESLSDDEESFPVDINKFTFDPLKKSEEIFVSGKRDRILTTIEFSPNKKMLAVRGFEDGEYRYFIFDRKAGTLVTSFEAYLAKWISDEKLLVSDSSVPNEIVRINKNGETQCCFRRRQQSLGNIPNRRVFDRV
jgi:WD40 repeat protein